VIHIASSTVDCHIYYFNWISIVVPVINILLDPNYWFLMAEQGIFIPVLEFMPLCRKMPEFLSGIS
jgi:hypothetical protein